MLAWDTPGSVMKGMLRVEETEVVEMIVPVLRAIMDGSTAWIKATGARKLSSRLRHQSVIISFS